MLMGQHLRKVYKDPLKARAVRNSVKGSGQDSAKLEHLLKLLHFSAGKTEGQGPKPSVERCGLSSVFMCPRQSAVPHSTRAPAASARPCV